MPDPTPSKCSRRTNRQAIADIDDYCLARDARQERQEIRRPGINIGHTMPLATTLLTGSEMLSDDEVIMDCLRPHRILLANQFGAPLDEHRSIMPDLLDIKHSFIAADEVPELRPCPNFSLTKLFTCDKCPIHEQCMKFEYQ